tara:strand:+ start:2803 stop:3678 length:876 start_codon:yes stop_codon:yes gene_type:complete
MKKFVLLCVIYLSISEFALAQNKKYVDSLTQLLKIRPDDTLKVGDYGTLHEQLMFSNPELALEYAKKALKLSKELNYNTGIASSNLQIGNYYYNKNSIDSAKYYYNKGSKIAKLNSITLVQIFANHSLASIEKDSGNYNEAIDIVMRNINLYDKNQQLKALHNKIPFNLIGAEYELLGEIQLLKGNYNIALKETLNALRFFEQTKDEIRKADALKQLGNIEKALGNNESSIQYSREALNIYEKHEDFFYQSSTANQIGENYIKLKNYNKAETYFKKSLKIISRHKIIKGWS